VATVFPHPTPSPGGRGAFNPLPPGEGGAKRRVREDRWQWLVGVERIDLSERVDP